MTLSVPQITAQLEAILERDAAARAVAIHAKSQQNWPASLTLRGRAFQLRWCESSLAIREALCDADATPAGVADANPNGVVILTPLPPNRVDEDIAARLARGRVFQPEGWEMVRQLFRANAMDARLGRYVWMPNLLVDAAAHHSYDPAPNAYLDLDTAWREFLVRTLALPSPRPDAAELLAWTLESGSNIRLQSLPADARTDVVTWLCSHAGPSGQVLRACLQGNHISDAVALGVVCGALFADETDGQIERGQAAVRLERFVGDHHISAVEGRAWAMAASQVIRHQPVEIARHVCERADELLRSLHAGQWAYLSSLLPSGLDLRLQAFSEALHLHSTTPTTLSLSAVEQAAQAASEHVLLRPHAQRMERLGMARRLSRWLLAPPTSITSVTTGACWQVDEGAFVDWARFRLLAGDELPALSAAYGDLRRSVATRREELSRAFSVALARENSTAVPLTGRAVAVEQVLEKVVAPIAADAPVMLLVMDGLSTSIFRELFDTVSMHGWTEHVPLDVPRPLAGVAALPTITEVSRASLLLGRLSIGTAPVEKAGFSAHAALLARSRTNFPPKLFHKGDLASASTLSDDLRTALADSNQRVVGVVFNAVDDHLSGPAQLNQRWSLDDLRLMLSLLAEARQARRVVVVTADHGHVLEDQTQAIPGGEADRWTSARREAGSGEVALIGGRVRTAEGDNNVICLWSESLRYTGRKNGYHGGVTLQEVTVPLSVFAPTGMQLAGWTAAPPSQPEWWDSGWATPTEKPTTVPTRPPRPSRRPAVPEGQGALFGADAVPPSATPTVTAGSDWVDALLASTVYATQRQLAARVAPENDRIAALLRALDERGGRMALPALAQRLGVQEVRMGGLLSAVRRVLNVDQAPVLSLDDTNTSVVLNKPLLRTQFGLNGNSQT